jgi:PPK2 family polyphosphate:nucleotide phosphotransferase
MSIIKTLNPSGPSAWEKDKIKKETELILSEIAHYLKLMQAESKQSILLIFQGMDASGKDGLTRELFKSVSPGWVQVHSFKKPTDDELAHDFLWRLHSKTPAKGMTTVFNRSYYEDILVPSVYGYIDKPTIEKRYAQINDFERMLEENGTKIIKCFLHIDEKLQEGKLLERINNPEKHWKHSDGDWETRAHWSKFMNVYDTIFTKCNAVPWNYIPCNKNWTKVYATASVILNELKKMNPQFPKLDSEKFIPNYERAKSRV